MWDLRKWQLRHNRMCECARMCVYVSTHKLRLHICVGVKRICEREKSIPQDAFRFRETIAFPYRKTCVQCWCVNLILFQLTTTTDCARLNCITITTLAKIHTHSHAHMYLVEFSAKTPRYGVWCVLRSSSWIVHSLDSYRELSAFFTFARLNIYIHTNVVHLHQQPHICTIYVQSNAF